jgi:hypothetical protein
VSKACTELVTGVKNVGKNLVGAAVDVDCEPVFAQRRHHSPDRSAGACVFRLCDEGYRVADPD